MKKNCHLPVSKVSETASGKKTILISTVIKGDWFLYFSAGADTGNAIYRRFFDPGGSHVGIAAHIGGLLTGSA